MKYYLVKKLIETEAMPSHVEQVLSSVLDTFYNEGDDINMDDFIDHARDEAYECLIYYADAWDYLQDNCITDFDEAIDIGARDVTSIATYYLEEACVDLIYEQWHKYELWEKYDKYFEEDDE